MEAFGLIPGQRQRSDPRNFTVTFLFVSPFNRSKGICGISRNVHVSVKSIKCHTILSTDHLHPCARTYANVCQGEKGYTIVCGNVGVLGIREVLGSDLLTQLGLVGEFGNSSAILDALLTRALVDASPQFSALSLTPMDTDTALHDCFAPRLPCCFHSTPFLKICHLAKK